MGWFWADTSNDDKFISNSTNILTEKSAGCPRMHSSSKLSQDISSCPVVRNSTINDEVYPLNPLNNMPSFIPSTKQPGQKLDLSADRTVSSIPKGDNNKVDKEFWEYPSPQQMYNAMVRKGKLGTNPSEEIPEDALESMVYVHNFLNEGCWEEILDWEKKYTEQTRMDPKLLKFMGKPDQVSPRARWFHLLGTIFPSKFSSELPFDRHDWTVLRADSSSNDPEHPGYRKVRYVIDFYSGADDDNGLPTFNVDVRPALDSFINGKDRVFRWIQPMYDSYFKESKD